MASDEADPVKRRQYRENREAGKDQGLTTNAATGLVRVKTTWKVLATCTMKGWRRTKLAPVCHSISGDVSRQTMTSIDTGRSRAL